MSKPSRLTPLPKSAALVRRSATIAAVATASTVAGCWPSAQPPQQPPQAYHDPDRQPPQVDDESPPQTMELHDPPPQVPPRPDRPSVVVHE